MKRREVEHPKVISLYFWYSDVGDSHNHARQSQLALEELWVTHDGYFQNCTTLIGTTLTDAWKAAKYQSNNPVVQNMTIKEFAGQTAWDCVHNKFCNTVGDSGSSFIQIPKGTDTVQSGKRSLQNHMKHAFDLSLNEYFGNKSPASQSIISPLSSTTSYSVHQHTSIKNKEKEKQQQTSNA